MLVVQRQTSVPKSEFAHLHAVADATGAATSMGIDELEALLNSLRLSQYLEAFRGNGYDEVADLRRMDQGKLCDVIGMKRGHADRLLYHFETEQKQGAGRGNSKSICEEV